MVVIETLPIDYGAPAGIVHHPYCRNGICVGDVNLQRVRPYTCLTHLELGRPNIPCPSVDPKAPICLRIEGQTEGTSHPGCWILVFRMAFNLDDQPVTRLVNPTQVLEVAIRGNEPHSRRGDWEASEDVIGARGIGAAGEEIHRVHGLHIGYRDCRACRRRHDQHTEQDPNH